jgi:hypothetical protein
MAPWAFFLLLPWFTLNREPPVQAEAALTPSAPISRIAAPRMRSLEGKLPPRRPVRVRVPCGIAK